MTLGVKVMEYKIIEYIFFFLQFSGRRRVGVKCSAYNCDSDLSEDTFGVKFHRFSFPKNEQLKNCWLKNMQMREWKPSANSVLCSKHFRREDIEVRLRPNAVPMFFEQFPPKIIEIPVCIKNLLLIMFLKLKPLFWPGVTLFRLSFLNPDIRWSEYVFEFRNKPIDYQ